MKTKENIISLGYDSDYELVVQRNRVVARDVVLDDPKNAPVRGIFTRPMVRQLRKIFDLQKSLKNLPIKLDGHYILIHGVPTIQDTEYANVGDHDSGVSVGCTHVTEDLLKQVEKALNI